MVDLLWRKKWPKRVDQFCSAIDDLADVWLDIDQTAIIFRIVRFNQEAGKAWSHLLEYLRPVRTRHSLSNNSAARQLAQRLRYIARAVPARSLGVDDLNVFSALGTQ